MRTTHLPPSNTEVKNEWSYFSTPPPVCLRGVDREYYTNQQLRKYNENSMLTAPECGQFMILTFVCRPGHWYRDVSEVLEPAIHLG
jgi:hypothetical protein